MKPLINQLTKNLSGCSGCGSNGASEPIYETWRKAKEKGEKMKFQFVIVVEAETYKKAVIKVPDDFDIIQGGVKPEPKPQANPNLPTVPTNMRTGLPVNG